MKQKQIILNWLRDKGEWVREYTIRGIDTPYGFIGARGDRNVRDLIKSGKLLASFEGKYRIVRYKEIETYKHAPSCKGNQSCSCALGGYSTTYKPKTETKQETLKI